MKGKQAVKCRQYNVLSYMIQQLYVSFFYFRETIEQQAITDSDELDTESPASSLDVDTPNNLDIYGITPPANQREMKRNKEKIKSHKSKKANQEFRDFIEAQRREKQRDVKRQGVMQNLREDMASCKLDDEEESLLDVSQTERQIKRRDSSKSFKTSRGYDRDYKNSSAGDLTVEISPVEIARVQSSIKVDSPNRFFSLNSKQVPGINDDKISTKPLYQRRQISSQVAECPKDRADFYRIFSQLINMGSEKKKDNKEVFHRQLSSEQLMWQNKVNDLVWLELQAWYRDVSIEEQDRYLIATREAAKNILNEIMNFHVRFGNEEGSTNAPLLEAGSPEYGRHPSIDIERPYSAQQMVNLSGIFEKHRDAMKQVSEILNKFETVEKLYPTLKALGHDHPVYVTDDFQMRMKTLYLWLNISKELGHKLKLMAKVLYIDQIQDIDWPWLEYDNPPLSDSETETEKRYCSSECLVETEDEDSVDRGGERDIHKKGGSNLDSGISTLLDHEKNVNKSVRFDVGNNSDTSSPSQSENHPDVSMSVPSDISTPQKPVTLRSLSHTSHASTMSRSNSSISVEELTHLSIYRYYADR